MAFLNQVRAKSRAKLIQLSLRGFFRLADICILAVYIWPFLFLKVKVPQSFLTLCDPMDYAVHGTVQTSIPEWVAIPFSRGSSQPGDRTCISCVSCIGRRGLYCLSHQGNLLGEYNFVTEPAPEYWVKIPEIINSGG